MPKKLILSVAVTSLLAVAGAAHAQSAFDGAYAGAQVGYDNYDFGPGDNAKDIAGGIFVGYNYNVADKIIVGAEANFGLTAADEAGVDVDESYGLSARAGFLASETVMFYGRGGWTRSNVDFVVGSKTFDGWNVGGGVEAFMADNVSVRGEFVYTNYETALGVEPSQKQFNIGVAYHY